MIEMLAKNSLERHPMLIQTKLGVRPKDMEDRCFLETLLRLESRQGEAEG